DCLNSSTDILGRNPSPFGRCQAIDRIYGRQFIKVRLILSYTITNRSLLGTTMRNIKSHKKDNKIYREASWYALAVSIALTEEKNLSGSPFISGRDESTSDLPQRIKYLKKELWSQNQRFNRVVKKSKNNAVFWSAFDAISVNDRHRLTNVMLRELLKSGDEREKVKAVEYITKKILSGRCWKEYGLASVLSRTGD
ncbi:MAG: hypothetical protein AB1638_12355, partial [Nitrospirota bacterium]